MFEEFECLKSSMEHICIDLITQIRNYFDMQLKDKYDFVIIGSGFGGSVSALRLAEKGYSVLVVEKGKWFNSSDFAKTNWNLPKW